MRGGQYDSLQISGEDRTHRKLWDKLQWQTRIWRHKSCCKNNEQCV